MFYCLELIGTVWHERFCLIARRRLISNVSILALMNRCLSTRGPRQAYLLGLPSLVNLGGHSAPSRTVEAAAKALVPRPTLISPPVLPDKDSPLWGNCAFLVDKPDEWTSHDVCSKMKHLFNTRKIGHAGTLDLLATGAPTHLPLRPPFFTIQAYSDVCIMGSGELDQP